jgi:spermidine/putrescine transport system permease protein
MALWMLLFMALPLLYILGISFHMRDERWGVSAQWTLANYKTLLEPLYLGVLRDSLLLAVQSTAISFLAGYPLAYAIAKSAPKRRALLTLLVIIPFWTSALMRTYGWMILLRADGPVNTILRSLGWINRPLRMLYTPGAVLLGMVYTLLPFMVLPCLTSLERMDWHIVEAARDLGAGPARAFLTVTIPLTTPGIVSGCMLVFVPTMGLYFINDLMGGGKSALLGRVIHDQMLSARNPPFGAALSVALIAITALVVFVQRRLGGRDIGIF